MTAAPPPTNDPQDAEGAREGEVEVLEPASLRSTFLEREPSGARRAGSEEQRLAGILCLLAAMAIVPAMDAIAKDLTERYAVLEVVWARYFFHFLLLGPLVLLRHRRAALLPPRFWLQTLRGLFLLAATGLFFAALARMPLADALALIFVSPLFVTAVSPVLLGESVGTRRRIAVGVGFLGALLIVRPGSGVFDWAALLALAAGLIYGCYILVTRMLSGTAPTSVTLTHTALLGALVTSLAVPFVWVTPSLVDLGFMLAIGLIAAAGHFLVIRAYDFASASFLAPFGYAEIVTATLLGYFVFGDFPEPVTWLGIAVVIASGIYIALRERRVSS